MTAQVNNPVMTFAEISDFAAQADRDIVVGAGIGGLCAAIALAGAGRRVLVLERGAQTGGKMRTLPSAAGPIDMGPTVLTLKDVFEGLFSRAGGRLGDYVTLIPQQVLARHFWTGGAHLDLFSDREANAQAIGRFAGPGGAREYLRFDRLTRQMYDAFDAPMMRARRPKLGAIAMAALRRPAIWPALLPNISLQRWLAGQFSDPRLVQLFGRYATYVGGAPSTSPAVLALVWQAEAGGVWAVHGGMGALAAGLERFARALGVQFRLRCHVHSIFLQGGRAAGVELPDGTRIAAQNVVFNGDPAALTSGLLGGDIRRCIPHSAVHPRSLSAYVWTFDAAVPATAPELVHHNVFFGASPAAEFAAIARGQIFADPTLYLCAQDRAARAQPRATERFEIIMNARALPAHPIPLPQEDELCSRRVFSQLARFGLPFHPAPARQALTMPQDLAILFPASGGAIYGRSPQSLLAPMLRPTAQTRIAGLVLAGGGAHPGAGVPMAALSGLHAAEMILNAPTFR